MDTFSLFSCLLICNFLFTFFNPVLTLTTQSTSDSGDDRQVSDASFATTESISATSTISTPLKKNFKTESPSTTTKKPKVIENAVPKSQSPTIQLRLAEESLRLNVTLFEKHVEFSLILNSTSKIGGISIAAAKRLLLALDNDEHFNVDVISIPLLPSKEQTEFSFGKKVEDWSWNKRNGVLVKDNGQNYNWIASGLENNSNIFVTFRRNWQTCDVQDIHFGLSPIKIWWLLDTEENKGPRKHDNGRMGKTSEKQKVTKAISSSEENNSTQQPSSNDKSSTIRNDTAVTNSTVASIEEVEVLKSIKESNFQGPGNFTFATLLKNVTSFFIKGCGEPSSQFLCNISDIPQLQSANRSSFLSVAKTFVQNFELHKKISGKTERCSIAIDYSNGGNEKQFQALFGFPNKNQGISVKPCWASDANLFMIMMAQVLMSSLRRNLQI